MYSSDELFQRSREGYFGDYFPCCEATREINTKITLARVSAETNRQEKTYIILFFTRHNESINDDKSTIFTRRPHVSLVWFLFSWRRHNRLLMTSQLPDNCDAITWVVIFNQLDINFVHGDIHCRSCKNCGYMTYLQTLSTSAPPWRL